MSTMSETVHRKVAAIRAHHEAHKQGKYGFLIRPVTLFFGWLITIGGFFTIPFPGPGWLTVFIGVGILSLELEWPNKLLDWALDRYDALEAWFLRQKLWLKALLSLITLVLVWIILFAMFWVAWNYTPILDWTKRWTIPLIEDHAKGLAEYLRLSLERPTK